ncbi:MAG: hypothetical protein HYW22_02875 [Candidatus Aenigmarchaeota archaeon]|nr:hypothetical protein [Candidatus Aenigmarchaeota archaeon]
MMQHSYTLVIDGAKLPNVGEVTVGRSVVKMCYTLAVIALPNLEADICGRLARLGYNFRSKLSGVILTDRELDPQHVHEIESFSEQYGVPVTVRYRRLD